MSVHCTGQMPKLHQTSWVLHSNSLISQHRDRRREVRRIKLLRVPTQKVKNHCYITAVRRHCFAHFSEETTKEHPTTLSIKPCTSLASRRAPVFRPWVRTCRAAIVHCCLSPFRKRSPQSRVICTAALFVAVLARRTSRGSDVWKSLRLPPRFCRSPKKISRYGRESL